MSANPTQQESSSAYPDRLTTHNYDGIQEYDNPMPLWWKAIFLFTVIWAVFYVAAIELGYIDTYQENLSDEMAIAEQAKAAQLAALPPLDEKAILAAMSDPEMAAKGEATFSSKCAACHGAKGEGLIGPNLTDNYWIYVGDQMSIYASIDKGRPNGMPAWGNILGREDMLTVAAYVAAMRGKNLDGPKGQQGDLFTLDGEGGDAPAAAEEVDGADGSEAVDGAEGDSAEAPEGAEADEAPAEADEATAEADEAPAEAEAEAKPEAAE